MADEVPEPKGWMVVVFPSIGGEVAGQRDACKEIRRAIGRHVDNVGNIYVRLYHGPDRERLWAQVVEMARHVCEYDGDEEAVILIKKERLIMALSTCDEREDDGGRKDG